MQGLNALKEIKDLFYDCYQQDHCNTKNINQDHPPSFAA